MPLDHELEELFLDPLIKPSRPSNVDQGGVPTNTTTVRVSAKCLLKLDLSKI
jgi:hypothetical protein